MNPETLDTLDVEVFRAGDYGPKGRYGDAELDAIAADYDAARHEAPVTLDHRQEGPAEGWVAGLRRMGDRLVATLGRLSPALRDLLARGAYRKRSVELYRRLPETGRPYLKAVSFLGAATPEVKGLADPVFAEEGETLAFAEDNAAHIAEQTRQRLQSAGRWEPAWEQLGLLDVFAALGEGPVLDTLVRVLERHDAPVHFGETLAAGDPLVDDGLAQFVGTPSPESVRHHREALAWLARNPGTNYAQALLQTAVRV